jgi:hypothetical protein
MEGVVMANTDQRKRWFNHLCDRFNAAERADGALAVHSHSGDDGDDITIETVARYLVIETAPGWGETRFHLADTQESMLELVARMIEGHAFGEDYGWQIRCVIDLETDSELSLKVKVSLT